MQRGRPKKQKESEIKIKPPPPAMDEVDEAKIPYKPGQIVCDIKVIAIKPESVRPIQFVYAKRGMERFDPVRKRNIFYDRMILRNKLGKVIWDGVEHSMALGDFERMVVKRREREPDAI
jgi:hypothetical protein